MSSTDLIADGYCIQDRFLSYEECRQLLADVADYRARFRVPKVFRNSRERPLDYSVIDGIAIKQHLPRINALLKRVGNLVIELSGTHIAPLSDERVACNVNITGNGGAYRWHYDRNRFTALIYLNEVAGGETEMYPNYRLTLTESVAHRRQEIADKLIGSKLIRNLFGKNVVCSTAAGRLVIMRGDRCLHSVRPVTGGEDRINIILSYDVPGATYNVADQLDSYLYSETAQSDDDPNYLIKTR